MNTTQEISEARKFIQNKKVFIEDYYNGGWFNLPQDVFLELLAEYKKTKTKPQTFIVRNVNCDEESLECAMNELFSDSGFIFLIDKTEQGNLFFTIEHSEKNISFVTELKDMLLKTGQNIEIEIS